jgi:hypothetical protein
MRISFDNLVLRSTGGLVAIYDSLKKTTWAFDLGAALSELQQAVKQNDVFSGFEVGPTQRAGYTGYDLTIKTANQTIVQNIPEATEQQIGLFTNEMHIRLFSLNIKDIQPVPDEPGKFLITYIDGSTTVIDASGSGSMSGIEVIYANALFVPQNIKVPLGTQVSVPLAELPAGDYIPFQCIVISGINLSSNSYLVISNDGANVVLILLSSSTYVSIGGDIMLGTLEFDSSVDTNIKSVNDFKVTARGGLAQMVFGGGAQVNLIDGCILSIAGAGKVRVLQGASIEMLENSYIRTLATLFSSRQFEVINSIGPFSDYYSDLPILPSAYGGVYLVLKGGEDLNGTETRGVMIAVDYCGSVFTMGISRVDSDSNWQVGSWKWKRLLDTNDLPAEPANGGA